MSCCGGFTRDVNHEDYEWYVFVVTMLRFGKMPVTRDGGLKSGRQRVAGFIFGLAIERPSGNRRSIAYSNTVGGNSLTYRRVVRASPPYRSH